MIVKRTAAVALALVILAGCSFGGGSIQTAAPGGGPSPTAGPTPINTSTAEGVASAFLDAWQAGDYATMYSLLDAQTQSATTQEAFTQQYTDAADAGCARIAEKTGSWYGRSPRPINARPARMSSTETTSGTVMA